MPLTLRKEAVGREPSGSAGRVVVAAEKSPDGLRRAAFALDKGSGRARALRFLRPTVRHVWPLVVQARTLTLIPACQSGMSFAVAVNRRSHLGLTK